MRLTMKPDGIWGNIFRLGSRKDSLAETLQNIPLFQELSPKELRILETLVHVRTYDAGEPVFVETEPGAGMYIIRTGRVDIVLQYRSENRIILSELEAGDFFGEMALLGDASRSATAIARDRSELIGFFHPDLIEIINLNPSMGAKISLGLSKTLAERLRYTNAQLRDVWQVRGQSEESLR
jgi:CRP/FNR family transcriptional regulator, cyclic AMP receptor protein